MFGKALGNGYAITAVIGRRSIMEAAQKTFISSTFWTATIGPTAALTTLDVMKRERSWEKISATGKEIAKRWVALAKKHNLKIKISGLPALASFSFENSCHQDCKTFLTQEMLKKKLFIFNVNVC